MSRPRRLLTSLDALQGAHLITAEEARATAAVASTYAVSITPHLADLIKAEGPNGPIGRQYLPDPREGIVQPLESADPIHDHPHTVLPGLIHRYPDRVLLKLVEVCPVYCRFCFRREMVGRKGQGLLEPDQFNAVLSYIAATPALFEAILSGGDPFILSARRVDAVSRALGAIEHVKSLRWHTRVPVADPERVTRALVRALRAGDARRKAVTVVIHVNHVAELVPAAVAAIARLVDTGVQVLSQSVLLKGLNDTEEALEALFRALTAARVKPYYLHQGDLAPGTGHWRTSLSHGPELMAALRGRLPGHALPTLVIDPPGGTGKLPLASALSREGIKLRDGRTIPHPDL
jgi:lysine 2,3-aminomutase